MSRTLSARPRIIGYRKSGAPIFEIAGGAPTLEEQRDQVLDQARAVIAGAKAAGRNLTADETTAVTAAAEKAKAINADIKASADAKAAIDSLAALSDSKGGQQLAGGFAAKTTPGRRWGADVATRLQKDASELRVKALLIGSIDVPNPVFDAPVAIDGRPETDGILGLVGRGTLAGNEYTFVRQTARTNNAAMVADGALKPTSVFTYTEVTGKATVVAHLSEPLPERIFDDHTALTNALATEMARGVEDRVQDLALNSATGDIVGILHTSGIVSVPFAGTMPATIRKAVTTAQTLRENPNAWVFSVHDAEALDLLADANDRPLGDDLESIFGGVPRFASTALPAGTAILADWSQAMLFTRQTVQLDADRSGDNFKHNQVQFRAEGRFGFAVLRPQSFLVVDLVDEG